MAGLCVSYVTVLRWTWTLATCLCATHGADHTNRTYTDTLLNNTDIGQNLTPQNQHIKSIVTPIDSTTQGCTDSDCDRVTTLGYNVTVCNTGFGYPDQCPQPGDPITHTKCCRYYQNPACCEPRARKVCAIKGKGLHVISAWDIDPDPEFDAIFCPQPDQSDQYVSCAYTRGDMSCFNRQTSMILVWVTSITIFILFPIVFITFTVRSIRAERREERQMLADGILVKYEVEVQTRMDKRKAERAAAVKAAQKAEEREEIQKHLRKFENERRRLSPVTT